MPEISGNCQVPGAQGAAVVSGIFAQEDVEGAARVLKRLSLEVFPG